MNEGTHQEETDPIMTLSEVAAYLKVAEKTVHRMIQKGEIPCAKVASQWRFSRTMIDDWLYARMRVLPRNDLGSLMQQEGDIVPLSRFITPENILPEMQGNTPREILEELVLPLEQENLLTAPGEFLQGLLDREAMVSTAVGRGIALPHQRKTAQNPPGNPRVILGRRPGGVDFGALDGGKTYLFFLIATNSEVIHLRLMAKITNLFRQGRALEPLMAAPSAQALAQTLIREEQLRLCRQYSETDTNPAQDQEMESIDETTTIQGGRYDAP